MAQNNYRLRDLLTNNIKATTIRTVLLLHAVTFRFTVVISNQAKNVCVKTSTVSFISSTETGLVID